MATNSDSNSARDTEQAQAKTLNELLTMLEDDSLNDEDIQAVNELINEIKGSHETT